MISKATRISSSVSGIFSKAYQRLGMAFTVERATFQANLIKYGRYQRRVISILTGSIVRDLYQTGFDPLRVLSSCVTNQLKDGT